MSRTETINKMVKMANKYVHKKDSSWTEEQKIWTICSDWNSEHYNDSEIFMCELGDDEGNVIGFMIEDDSWYYPESWN